MKLNPTILVFFLVLNVCSLFAQIDDSSKKVVVTMLNGEEYKGEVVKKSNEIIVLKTLNGRVELIVSNIDTIEEDEYKGKYSYDNPIPSKYFLGPSAIPLKKGKGYYNNTFLSINSVNYGVSDHVSVGGGVELISLFQGIPLWFVNSKIGYQISEKVHVGGGVNVFGVAAEGAGALGFGYGMATFGGTESNVTVGVGYGLVDGFDDESGDDTPIFMLSGTRRVSKKVALMSENFIAYDDSGNIFHTGIHGVRLISRNHSFDIGILTSSEWSVFDITIPYVSYTKSF